MDFLKYGTKKTKVHVGENYIFSIQTHSKKWIQAGMISLFYDLKKKKKKYFREEKVEKNGRMQCLEEQ